MRMETKIISHILGILILLLSVLFVYVTIYLGHIVMQIATGTMLVVIVITYFGIEIVARLDKLQKP